MNPTPISTVLIAGGPTITVAITIDSGFEQYSTYLVNLLRARAQWMHVPNAIDEIVEDCSRWLHDRIADAPSMISQIARYDVIEVRIPEGAPLEARAFPWEFVIAEITRVHRRQRKSALVVRQLQRDAKPNHSAVSGV